MITVLVAMALAQAPLCFGNNRAEKCLYEGNRVTHGNHTGRAGGRSAPLGAYFELAPASGAGMGVACAGTAITGSKGEPITIQTRASSAYCTKEGAAMTGLTTSSMVLLASNQIRVETLSGSILGVRTEPASTNNCLRSQEIDNAAWSKEQDSAPRTPTVTADFATAPDGTLTADRVQFPATAGAEFSDVYQLWTTGGAADPTACSAYVRGTSGSGTLDICRYDGAAWACNDCAFVTATWSRCSTLDPVGSGTTSRFCKIGNNGLQNGGVARAASDVVLWGAQGEATAYASSYIPTAGATATRAQDQVSTNLAMANLTASGCTAMTVLPLSTTVPLDALIGGNTARYLYFNGASMVSYDGTNNPVLSAGYVVGTPKRYRTTWSGSAINLYNTTDATTTSSGFDGTMTDDGLLRFAVGAVAGVGPAIWGLIQLDPSPTRCQ